MPSLDVHPGNELGTGVLPDEASLIEGGMVFARRLTDRTGHTFILCGKRPIVEAATAIVKSAHMRLERYPVTQPVPARPTLAVA